MSEESRKSGRHYGIIAACAVLALAVVAGAYWMGRSAGAGKDVGEETAKLTALGHAQVSESGLSRYEIARDDSDGVPVYEVKFTADGVAYDYEINAADGSIVKFSREARETAPPPIQDAPAPESGDIGEARAWEIAYGHAGVAAADAAPSPAKLDYDDGRLVYELEFFSGGYEYDYEISAADGGVVKFEKEPDVRTAPVQTPAGTSAQAPAGDSSGTPARPPAASGTGDIGEAKAKEIALAHAGVTADSVTGYRWELDDEGGARVYELEFFSGGCEYDYKISAADGSVVKFEKESAGGPAAQSGQSPSADTAPAYIGEARAKEIALAHAGLTADAVARCAVELDHHDGHGNHHGAGCCEYEVDFKSGGYEYEYKIDAVTGEILEFERDLDD